MDLQREAEGRQLITSRQAARSESLFSTGSHGDVNAPWSPSLSLQDQLEVEYGQEESGPWEGWYNSVAWHKRLVVCGLWSIPNTVRGKWKYCRLSFGSTIMPIH